ncbi:MAG: hypothetical protein ACYDEI_00130 [Erysipelotrichaceae bacterium]
MAQNKIVTLPKLDLDQFKNNPNYNKIISELNKDPLTSYRELTILEETSNPLSIADGGINIIKDLKSHLMVNPNEVEQAFKIPEIPDQLKQAIDQDPERAYKETFNQYAYGNDSTASKEKVRGILSYTKRTLIDKGKNPDDVLNSNAFTRGLDFVGNLVSVPSNVLAKGYAALYGKSDKIKIWGGSGWIDTLKEIDSDETAKSLLEKRKNNIPLTTDEQKQLKRIKGKYGGWGTLLNIVIDPTILIGAAGKSIGLAAKAGKSATLLKIGSALKAVESPISTFKELKTIKNLEESGQLADIIKNNLKLSKDALGDLLTQTEKTAIDTHLNIPLKEINVPNALKTLDDITKTAKKVKPEFGNVLEKSNKNISNKIFELDVFKNSKTLTKIDEKAVKLRNQLGNISENMGIRKAFISDLPVLKDEKGVSAKEVYDTSRRLKTGANSNIAKIQNDIVKKIKKNIKPVLEEELKKSDSLVFKSGLKINELIPEIIEKPKKILEYGLDLLEGDKGKEFKDSIQSIHNSFDDIIMNEAKVAGSKTKPLLPNDDLRKQWDELADKYKTMLDINPYHTELPQIESKMRGLLSNKLSNKIYDDNTIQDLGSDLAYLTHSMPKETQRIFQTFDNKSKNNFAINFRSFISNPSFKKRGFEGSISDVNKYIKQIGEDGKTQFVRDIEMQLTGDMQSGKLNKTQFESGSKFADDMNKFAKILNEKDLNFFDTDIGKLFSIRGSRMSRVLEQESFYKNIQQFGSDVKQVGFEKPKLDGKQILGLTDTYYPQDISQTIEKIWGVTKNPHEQRKFTNQLVGIARDFQNFWRSMTLSLYPVTVLRNLIGNISNSILIVKNPAKLITSYKDSLLGLLGKDYKITSNNGKISTLQNLIREFEQRGITSTTLKSMDTGRDITEGISPIGGAISKAGEKLDIAAKKIASAPTAQFNDLAEKSSKLALAIELWKEGKSYDEAALGAYKALFDYGDLTEFDRAVKTVIPFWTWTRKNLPYQIQNLLSTPTKTMLKLEQDLNRDTDIEQPIDERFQSDWLQNVPKLEAGRNKKTGKPQYILLEGLLPTFDISRIIRASTGYQALIDDTIKDMSPFIKTPIETVTNRSFAMHKDISKSKYDTAEFLGFNMNPYLKNALDDWRVLSTISKGINIPKMVNVQGISQSPEKNISKMIFSWAIISPTEYDINLSRSIQKRDYSNTVTKEINDFRGYVNKIKQSILNGNKIKQGDTEDLRRRIKNIFLMIQQGYTDAKLDNKERGKYSKMLITALE